MFDAPFQPSPVLWGDEFPLLCFCEPQHWGFMGALPFGPHIMSALAVQASILRALIASND